MYVDQKTEGEAITREKWRDILLRMRDTINERGWCQGKAQDEQGRVCLVGAYDFVTDTKLTDHGIIIDEGLKPTDTFRDSAYHRLGEALNWLVTDWNDAPGRTQAEVIAFLERLARE